VLTEAVEPTLWALQKQGIDFRGILYAGLMLTPDGPKMLEYNVRFGDPEAQVLLPLLESDLSGHLHEAATGRLRTDPVFSTDAAVCVVLAAEGYPVRPRTGDEIRGIEAAAALPGVAVYAAGVAAGDDGHLRTGGGRVLNVVGRGPDLAAARARAYAGVDAISWPGSHFRRDIGASGLR
jgi:phosphoribosylamine--glycine ligase